jgi:two-component system sensor histidine kinase/response regulator
VSVEGRAAAERGTSDEEQFEGDARTAAILDSGPDCVIALDHARRVLAANALAEQMFGYATGAMVGRELSELALPRDPQPEAGDRRVIERRLRAAVGRWIDVTAVRADGGSFPRGADDHTAGA